MSGQGAIDDLFGNTQEPRREQLAEGAVLLRGFALEQAPEIIAAIRTITSATPFRHMITPGGFRMSVALCNCGPLGWVTDETGYRYTPRDPVTGQPWPVLPELFLKLARDAAQEAGFDNFSPDACLINRYEPGARMTLHQDRNERDFREPIVSVSLGLPAIFLFGGTRRADRPQRLRLEHGDVVVWGGPARLNFHGVAPLANGWHELTGGYRFNLTFRKAG